MHTVHSLEPLEARIAPAKVFALDVANHLLTFDSATPGTTSAAIDITGLGASEFLGTIAFRPSDGALFGVGLTDNGDSTLTGRVYRLDPATGAATVPSAAFSTTLPSNAIYDCAIEPQTGFLRFTDSLGLNLRVNADTGALIATDTALSGLSSPTAIAYSNNFSVTGASTLYAINFGATSDELFRIGGANGQPSPNGGAGTKIADLSALSDNTAAPNDGLDILTTLGGDTAFFTATYGGLQKLETLNLRTGGLTDLGTIGAGALLQDIALQPPIFTFPEGKTFTYTDGDGDLVRVKTSAGTLKSSQFHWLTSADGTRRELRFMDVHGDTSFTGANLSFTAKKTATGGDGRVDLGYLDLAGVDVGAITIGGNLEDLEAGSGGAAFAVKSLTARSLGGATTDTAAGSLAIKGKLGALTIKGDVTNAAFSATSVDVTKIGGSILGGAGDDSSHFMFAATKSFSVGGSIVGGAGKNSANLELGGTPATVKIGGSVLGGRGNFSGQLFCSPTVSLTIGGDIIGGDVGGTNVDTSGLVTLQAATGTVKVGGSIIGSGDYGGSLAGLDAKSVTIGGSIVGNPGYSNGFVSFTKTGSFKLGGSIVGGKGGGVLGLGETGRVDIRGSLIDSGNGGFFNIASVQTFTMGGSIVAGTTTGNGGSGAGFGTAGSITIKGGLQGTPDHPATLSVSGKANPATAADALAVKSIAIGGNVVFGEIFIGGSTRDFVTHLSVQAQSITIGGDFIASNIVNGFEPGADGFYGTADDKPDDLDGNNLIKATIASIIIKGRATGTSSSGDSYGIQAEKIGSVTIGGRKVALDPLGNDNVLVGAFADLRIRELPIP